MPAILPLTTPAPQSTSALGTTAAAPGAGASLPILHTGNSPREMPQTSSSSLSTTEIQRAITQNTGSVLSALGITQNSAANSGPEGASAPSQPQTAPSTVETSVTKQRGFGTPSSENLDDLFEETPQKEHSREKRDTGGGTGTTETCSYSQSGSTQTQSYTVDETFDSSTAKEKCTKWLKQNKEEMNNQCDNEVKTSCGNALKKAIEKDGAGKCDSLKTYMTGSTYGLLKNANTGALGEIKTSTGICSSQSTSSSGASSGAGAGSSSGSASPSNSASAAPAPIASPSNSTSAAPEPIASASNSTLAAAAPATTTSTTAAPTITATPTTAEPGNSGTEGINYTRMAQIIGGILGGVSTAGGVLWGFYQYYLGGGRQRETLGDAKLAGQVKQLEREEEEAENTNQQRKADLELKKLKAFQLKKELLDGPGNHTLSLGERKALLEINPLNDGPDNDSKDDKDSKDDPGKKNQQKIETLV